MSEDIRKMIDKVKNFKQFVNENVNDLTTLYHGSKFLFNKFDMSRVNTGQHSQDFGYGLYFTSNKDTAKFYANELSNTKTPIEKYNDNVVDFQNHTYRSLFIVMTWWGLHFLILLLVF
jgi:hypothetical protein